MKRSERMTRKTPRDVACSWPALLAGAGERLRPLFRNRDLLHDLATREHDAEDEENGHGSGIDENLDEEDKLGEQNEIDSTNRDERHRQPKGGMDELLRRNDHDGGADFEDGQDEERRELPVHQRANLPIECHRAAVQTGRTAQQG